MKARHAAGLALAGALVGAQALGVGCSLGLDESKLGAPPAGDAGVTPPGADGAPRPDAQLPPDADVPATDGGPDAGAGCAADRDCVAPNACLTARCDVARNVCVFDLCKQTAACARAACSAQSLTCGAPVAVPFHAGQFKVGAGVGCGGAVGRCIAAAGGFLFVGTAGGVLAFSVADPGNAAPSPIAVTGLPFAPTEVVASGGRVYVTGGLVGGRVQVAWIDPPSSPLATAAAARSVLLTTQLTAVSEVFAAPGGGVFLVQSDGARAFPAASFTAPIADLATLSSFPSTGAPTPAAPVAASGDRLVFYRWTQQGALGDLFTVVAGAATAAAKAGPETNVGPDIGTAWGTPATVRFAQGPGGGLAWGVPIVQIVGPGADTRAARLAWVLADGAAATPTATKNVDLESYAAAPAPFGQAVAGPLAWVDPTTLLATAQAHEDLAQTSVQVALNVGTSPAVVAARRVLLPVPTDRVGVTAAGGYGYVVTADAADAATVHVFAPACP